MNFSCMSEEEIRQSYKQAKDQKMQITVLAELTLSTEKEMMEFLSVPMAYEIKSIVDREALEAEYKRLYDDGLSDAQIGKRTMTTKGMVNHWRRSNGLPTKQSRGRSHDKCFYDESWFEVYKMGLSDTESGKLLSVSSRKFNYFRIKHKLPANKNRFER